MRKIAVVMVLFFFVIRLHATNYYVSNTGNDSNNGLTTNSPWKTIKKVNSMMNSFQPGDSILFKRGNIWHEQLSITADGSQLKSLVFAAFADGDEPVLSGTAIINNWVAGANGIYYAGLTKTPNIVIKFSQLVNPSRWPENKKVFAFPDNNGGNNYITDSDINLTEINPGAMCHIKSARYYINHLAVHSYDYGSRTLMIENLEFGAVSREYGYFLTGVISAINEPGEWAYDSEKKQIFISGDPANIEVGSIDIVVIINAGANYVTLKNMKITGANLTGLSIRSNSVTIDDCTIENNYDTGIEIEQASNVNLIHSRVANICGTGIHADYAEKLNISGNYITGIGTNEQDGDVLCSLGEGIWIGNSADLKIRGNHIKNCARTGIDLYNNAKRNRSVSYNLIENTMLSSDDGGAIYTAPDKNSIVTWDSIHHNIIINSKGSVNGTQIEEAEAVGIYIDEPQANGVQENWVIKDNSVTNTTFGIYLHDARNCKIEGNLLYLCSSGILLGDKKQSSGDYRMTGIVITENRVVAENSSVFLFFVVDDYTNFTIPQSSDGNIFANQSGTNLVHYYNHGNGNNVNYDLSQWRTFSHLDQNSVVSQVSTQFNKKHFIYNATFKKSVVTFPSRCQYRTILNQEVPQSFGLEPYTAEVFYSKTDGSTDCNPVVENNPINSPPIINTPSSIQSIAEDGSRIFNASNGNLISITDLDNTTSTITITTTNGTSSLSGTTGLTFKTGDGSGDLTMTFSGSIANLNNALNSLTFKPIPDFTGTASLLVTSNDGDGGTDRKTIIISVTAVNDFPVITVPLSKQNIIENATLVFSTTNNNQISVSDRDNTSATITITTTNGTFSLSGTTGLAFTTGDGSGDATMTFSGLISNIITTLNAATFKPAAGYTGEAQVLVYINDGSGGTDNETIHVAVSGVTATNTIIKKLLSIYPNPASNFIFLQFDEAALNKGRAKIEVISLIGQVLLSKIIENIETGSDINISLDGYKNGTYLVVLTLGKEHQVDKLIINNVGTNL